MDGNQNDTNQNVDGQSGSQQPQGAGDNQQPQGQQQGQQQAQSNQNAQATGQQGSDRVFTQDEVTRMMAREKSQGRNAVYNDLGLDPNDAKSIAMVKALLASQKDESGSGEGGNGSNEALEEANHRAAIAEAKAEAMMMGIAPNYVDDAVALALPKVAEGNDLKSVIAELKGKYPIWTNGSSQGEEGNGNEGVGKKGTGSSVGTNNSGNGSGAKDQGIGARLAANRRASKPKTSYWKNS